MVYSLFDRPKTTATPAGTHFEPKYQEEITKKGKQLHKIGKTDIYAIIQSHSEECKIENILAQAAKGDYSMLKAREATYMDATTMPKTLMELENLTIKMKDEFYNMPIEVRKEFNNDPEQYITQMGTEEFKKKMAPYNDKIAKIAEEKNHAEYLKKVNETAKFYKDVENAGGTEE